MNLYICVDLFIYTTFASIMLLLSLGFVLWVTGLKDLIIIMYNWNEQKWMELFYLMISLSVLGGIGFGFKHLLDIMDQNIVIINTDRRFLLQQNLDLMKENQEIKKVMKKLIGNLDIEDKNVLK